MRPHFQRLVDEKRLSERQLAAVIGIAPPTLKAFLQAEGVPQESTLRLIEQCRRHNRNLWDQEFMPHQPALVSDPENPFATGVSDVPGAERLKGAARDRLESWFFELKGRGLSHEDVINYAREALGPIARGETRYSEGEQVELSEGDQMDVLEALIPILKKQLRGK